jgi:hypothetical protein
MTVTIIVAPIASSPGRFMTKLASDGDVLVTSSRSPFLDEARRLLELGYSADAGLVMRHAGSVVDSLCATVGTAARLTVKEKAAGSVPRLARWEPYRSSPVSPPIAPNVEAATTLADAPENPLSEPAGPPTQ